MVSGTERWCQELKGGIKLGKDGVILAKVVLGNEGWFQSRKGGARH